MRSEALAQPAREWYSIRNETDGGVAEVHIYDEISWFGITAQEFMDSIKGLTAKQIDLHINSPGGNIFDGIAIMNALRFHPANVTTYVDSIAASIASVIAMAGNEIVMMPGSQMMIHKARGGVMGDSDSLRAYADLLDRNTTNIAAIYAGRRGSSPAAWLELMNAETWFTAEEAVEAGLADRIMEDAEPAQNVTSRWDLSLFNYAGREHAPAPALELIKNSTETGENTSPVDTVAGSHSTSVVGGTWSRSAQEKNLPTPVPLAKARKFYTAWDSGAVTEGGIPKSAGHLPHHQVSSDGTPGAAVRAGVIAAKGRANQVKGLSAAEVAAALSHLRGHVPDEDQTEEENALLAEMGYTPENEGGDPGKPAPDPDEEMEDDDEDLAAFTPELMRDAIVAADESFAFDPEDFRSLVKDAANNMPAPTKAKPELKADEDDDVKIDMSGFKKIIRKVAKNG